MGEVWLASRSDRSLHRKVALKLPYSLLMAGVQRRRFERERDILAALSHPSIAQLYDAGVSQTGTPYLAMEWVDGSSIVEHCREHRLPLARRLELFLQVLNAVGYAHGRLIAHRDLKPGNILVTRDGSVKLLDFGIAKLLVEDTAEAVTALTRVGTAIATPGYAAPEQLAGAPITAAVDIYALGVILFELLTGQRPFEDPLRALREKKPVPPASMRIDDAHAALVGGLGRRQLQRALSGDLNAIVTHALEISASRRYQSAGALASDIQRSRDHQPITARPVNRFTRGLKFVRRNWFGVALSTLLVLALVIGSAAVAWQAVRAERETQRATSIKDFLVSVFRASDPRIGSDRPRGQITARELLDASTDRIPDSFKGQPATQAELLGVIADIYRELDEPRRSSELYAREAQLSAKFFGVQDPRTIDGLLGQAYNAELNGETARALDLLNEADAAIRAGNLDRSVWRARWWMIRGETLAADRAHADEAPAALERGATLFKEVAPADALYIDDLLDLGALSMERGDFGASAAFHRQAIARAGTGADAEGRLLLANEGLAEALKLMGDFSGAAAAYQEGARIALRTYGRGSPRYWGIVSGGAKFRYQRGDRESSLRDFEGLLGELPAERAGYHNESDADIGFQVFRDYGYCLATDGQSERAVALLERARDLLPASTSRGVISFVVQGELGKAYAASGQTAAARRNLREALEGVTRANALPLQVGTAHLRWGRFLQSQGDLDAARAEFEEVLRLSTGHVAEAVNARASLAEIAIARGEQADALSNSAQAMDELQRIEGFYDIRIQPTVWRVRAQALLLAGDRAGATALAERAVQSDAVYYSPQSAELRSARALLSNH